MQQELTKVDDGVWTDNNGNHYHEEQVLRYRVYFKHLHKPYDTGNWLLHSSHSIEQSAIDTMFDEKEDNGDLYDYKLVDNGEATTIKRLLY